ncbi:hypothetical protein [Lysinibacillus sp. NPDC047702]|uniref:hypothetical protein n=1 Tax=unclassified Lysinibacillus TaxID=2636778 RepID=UPI003D025530
MVIYVIHLYGSKGTATVVDTGYKKLERAQNILKNIGFEMVDETNFRKSMESGNVQKAQIVEVHFYD